MDPANDLPELVEDLEVNIDELTDALQPLLSTPLHTTASSLPLLDKAKLYVLAAYAVESLLFSTLQASGANAKEHAIFKELARLKTYFAKVKEIEARPQQQKPRLDVGAAQRFIKHGLAGNERYDLARAERVAKEKARAALKAKQINKKFDDQGEELAGAATPKKRVIEEVAASSEEGEVLEGPEQRDTLLPAQPTAKKPRVSAADLMDVDSAPSPASQPPPEKMTKKERKRLKGKKTKTKTPNYASPSEELVTPDPAPAAAAEEQGDRAGQDQDEAKAKEEADPTPESQSQSQQSQQQQPQSLPPQRSAPKTRSQAFNALLNESQSLGVGVGVGETTNTKNRERRGRGMRKRGDKYKRI